MAGLHPPTVTAKVVPVFTAEELSRIERPCAGRRSRSAAIVAVFRAAGIRLSELAGIRYDPADPRHGDVDGWQREMTVRGKGRCPSAALNCAQPASAIAAAVAAPTRRRFTTPDSTRLLSA
jgi:site-specific recombinase XerC